MPDRQNPKNKLQPGIPESYRHAPAPPDLDNVHKKCMPAYFTITIGLFMSSERIKQRDSAHICTTAYLMQSCMVKRSISNWSSVESQMTMAYFFSLRATVD